MSTSGRIPIGTKAKGRSMGFSRREFLAVMMAGGAVIAGELWIPGQKLISIPSHKIFIPEGQLAWFEGLVTKSLRRGEIITIPAHFNVEIVGAETRSEWTYEA